MVIALEGVSGIIATAIMLSLTIAGGVIIYAFVTSYLNNISQEGKLIIENAYYITALRTLVIEVRNIGSGDARLTEAIIIYQGDIASSITPPQVIIPPGTRRTLEIQLDQTTSVPRLVALRYNNGDLTDPFTIRIR